MKFGKTIKIFLIDGDPNCRMSCELSNWTGKAYKIPRVKIKGTKPWIVFGSNAIAIYVLAVVFETIFLHSGLHDWAMNTILNTNIYVKNASLIWAVFSVLVCFSTALFLYRKRIFIKL